MRRYETIYILRPTLSEDEVNASIDSANSILKNNNGEIISLDKWGLRTLAYLIQNETQGYYVYCDYATEPGNVTEMERKFRIDESVMKYMTVKLADSIDTEGIEAARGEHEAAVVAAAEAEAEAAKQEEEQNAPKPAKREEEKDTPKPAQQKEEKETPKPVPSEASEESDKAEETTD